MDDYQDLAQAIGLYEAQIEGMTVRIHDVELAVERLQSMDAELRRGLSLAQEYIVTLRLRGLGNAVVPQVAEFIGRRIVEAYS